MKKIGIYFLLFIALLAFAGCKYTDLDPAKVTITPATWTGTPSEVEFTAKATFAADLELQPEGFNFFIRTKNAANSGVPEKVAFSKNGKAKLPLVKAGQYEVIVEATDTMSLQSATSAVAKVTVLNPYKEKEISWSLASDKVYVNKDIVLDGASVEAAKTKSAVHEWELFLKATGDLLWSGSAKTAIAVIPATELYPNASLVADAELSVKHTAKDIYGNSNVWEDVITLVAAEMPTAEVATIEGAKVGASMLINSASSNAGAIVEGVDPNPNDAPKFEKAVWTIKFDANPDDDRVAVVEETIEKDASMADFQIWQEGAEGEPGRWVLNPVEFTPTVVGTYYIELKVTNNLGNEVTSAPITVTVAAE